MGDDNPDIKVLKVVGISTCPNDASVDVKSVCDYSINIENKSSNVF